MDKMTFKEACEALVKGKKVFLKGLEEYYWKYDRRPASIGLYRYIKGGMNGCCVKEDAFWLLYDCDDFDILEDGK